MSWEASLWISNDYVTEELTTSVVAYLEPTNDWNNKYLVIDRGEAYGAKFCPWEAVEVMMNYSCTSGYFYS